MNKKIIIGLVTLLLVLSFIPFWADALSEGGSVKVNFWQKIFMKID